MCSCLPSSVVTECYEDVSLDSDWECVEPQSFYFPIKVFGCVGRESRRDELRRDASKSVMPPTPQQSSHSSTDVSQWQVDSPERTVTAGMENYLDKSNDMKLEIEELEWSF